MAFIKKIFVLLPLLMAGCATPGAVNAPTGKHPLKWIQKVTDSSTPLGTRQISTNGREFYSNYFVPKGKKLMDAAKMARRYYAKISILGDRRPYKIEVVVVKEKRVASGYEMVRHDQRIAKALLKRIQKRLDESRGKRNVIDDFRAF